MTTLAALRGRLRTQLHDEDAANYRWTDATLDQHLAKAIEVYSMHAPREQKTATTTTATRDLTLLPSTLTGFQRVVAVEYPTGAIPQETVDFRVWGDAITMLTDGLPGAGKAVNVYWHGLHDTASPTHPAADDWVIILGAGAYAYLEWSGYAVNRVNIGGEDVERDYLNVGATWLKQFTEELRRRWRGSVKVGRMYVPAVPMSGETTDFGPGSEL